MIDFTLNKEDKDSYIVDVRLNENETYTVTYASGREETNPFTIHNYQVELFRMEEQFLFYKNDYEEDLNEQFSEQLRKCVISNVISMLGVIITCGFDIHLAIKLILAFVGAIVMIYNLRKVANKRKEMITESEKAAMVEVLLNHKKDIELTVINPANGSEEKWYMVDVNNIEQFTSAYELAMYTMPYRVPQVKEEMERDMTQAFKDAYTLKKNKQV